MSRLGKNLLAAIRYFKEVFRAEDRRFTRLEIVEILIILLWPIFLLLAFKVFGWSPHGP